MRRLRPLAALLLATGTLGSVGWTGGAVAQSSDKQQQLQEQLEESSAAEQAARAQLVKAQADRDRLNGVLADVNAKVGSASARLAAAQAVVDQLANELVVLQQQADETQQKLDQARDDVRRSAVLLYRHGDGAAMIGLLSSTDGSGQLVEGKHYLQRVSDKRQADATRVAKLKEQLDGQRSAVTQQKSDADTARQQAADEKAQLDQLAAQQQSALAAANNAEQTATAARDKAIAQHDEAEAGLAAESARIAALVQAAGDVPLQGDGTFLRPVGGPVSSSFGYRKDPVTGATAYHAGLDFASPCGTPIKAAGAGIVLTAGFNSGGYGNMTVLNHGKGLSTLYGHQSSIIVATGQVVTKGQVIGYVGSTGKSTGCHLHFEVRLNGNPVDPNAYL
jgi:murein DD-endopeptidase MepM/ murein hydrolase activator NlpD